MSTTSSTAGRMATALVAGPIGTERALITEMWHFPVTAIQMQRYVP